jgi:putative glycosyltransferase
MQAKLPPERCHLSIVTCVYKSYPFLKRFIELSLDALRQIGCSSFELVFVVDGSPDASLDLLLEEKTRVPQIVVIEFSRNFGHHYAAHAGLRYASGELVFLIDCDLEVSPLVLVEFYGKVMQDQCDVVYGYQNKRKGGWFERWSGGLFWRLFNALSDTPVPPNIVTERLLSRRYVDSLLKLGDRNLFLAGMMQWVGFKQLGLPVEKVQREGASTYTIRQRIALLIDAVTSFSAVPLRLLFSIGVFITCGAVAFIIYLIINKILNPSMVLVGFTSISVLILFSLGVVMSSIGIVGIYLSKIFRQIQNRPLFIVKNIYL